MNAENANQLFYIINYLIDYLKSKEKLYIDRVINIINIFNIVR